MITSGISISGFGCLPSLMSSATASKTALICISGISGLVMAIRTERWPSIGFSSCFRPLLCGKNSWRGASSRRMEYPMWIMWMCLLLPCYLACGSIRTTFGPLRPRMCSTAARSVRIRRAVSQYSTQNRTDHAISNESTPIPSFAPDVHSLPRLLLARYASAP